MQTSAFQALITNNSYGYFLTVDQLHYWLDESKDALEDILCRGRHGGHKEFLTTFGITSRIYKKAQTFCLQGVGCVALLGRAVWKEFATADLSPRFL